MIRDLRRGTPPDSGKLDTLQAFMTNAVAARLAGDRRKNGDSCQDCLYPSFQRLRELTKPFHKCKTVVYTVALYPKATEGQIFRHAKRSPEPGKFQVHFPPPVLGEEANDVCNVALVTNSTVFRWGSSEGWNYVDIDELVPFPSEYSRSAHTLRATPFLLFPNAKNIYYGDTKCSLWRFRNATQHSYPNATLVGLKHGSRHLRPGNMVDEFNEAFLNVKGRKASRTEDLNDIVSQFVKYRAEGYLVGQKTVRLSDNNCETINESMRTQLSFNYALDKEGVSEIDDVVLIDFNVGNKAKDYTIPLPDPVG